MTTPSLEAIQEVNVITSSYGAEWARNGGGVVNAVTKSGTNRFSGSAYDFLRNDGLNANSFFRNMDRGTADQQRSVATPIQQLRVHARRAGAPAAGSCFSSSRRSGGGAIATKGTNERRFPTRVADRSRQPELRSARGAGPECGEAAGSLACAERTRDQSISDDDHERVRYPSGVRASGLQHQRELVVDRPLSARSSRLARRVSTGPDLSPGHRSSGRPARRGGGTPGRGAALARIVIPVVEPSASRATTACTGGTTSDLLIPETLSGKRGRPHSNRLRWRRQLLGGSQPGRASISTRHSAPRSRCSAAHTR